MIPIYLSLGAGVQSSTLALMAAKGEISMPKAAIFADTQDEPQSVYRWLDWLKKQLPFPVYRVTKGRLSDESLRMRVSAKGLKFPCTNIPFFTKSPTGELGKIPHRSCTADFKIKPILKELRKQIGPKLIAAWHREHKGQTFREKQKDALAVSWIGISLDEMQRMKESRDPWVRCEWPLIERRMTRQHCLDWMAKNNYPVPPRSSCVYCPFHRNSEWRRLQTEEPEAFQQAVEFEREIQRVKARTDNMNSTPFLHRSCKPLGTIDFRSDIERGQGVFEWGFEEECEGMCCN